MKKTTEEIKQLLNIDPCKIAEETTGKGPEDDKTAALGFAIAQKKSQKVNQTLKELGDSTHGCEIIQYLEILKDEGFEKVSETKISDTTLFILFQPTHGVLLVFDTTETRVNGAHMYYNWKPKRPEKAYEFTSSGGFYPKNDLNTPEKLIWAGNHDAREAVRFNLRQLRNNGKFITPWQYSPNPYLLCYKDWKNTKSDPDQTTKERFKKLPDNVKNAIKVAFEE